ncbi:MAG TPA: LytTR family DNA-binding domain-containing protein [Xanthomonadales bacterium]|nr:LytTR family DNA-binding domain-containing protein [Xanthomonadales bacterium]
MDNEDNASFWEGFNEPANKWLFSASVGLFMSLFMIAFQPFGVTNHDPDFEINLAFLSLLFGFGVLVTLVLAANEFFVRPLVVRSPGHAGMVVWIAWVYILVGSVLFLLYNFVGNWHDFSFSSWLGFLRDVGMIITFPIAGFMFYLRHQALKSEYTRLQSNPPESSNEMVTFTSENGKDPLLVSFRDLLYLESEDNYVNISYLENRQPKSHLIRSSLKRLEGMIDDPNLARCHRSFIVNLSRVRSCRGNRHGLHLKLQGMDGIVPVSRKYTDRILDTLQAGPATSHT